MIFKSTERKMNMKKILSFVLSLTLFITSAFICPLSAGAATNSVFVSTDGVIEGYTGTVYTSLSSAFSALGSSDGVIYLEGEDVLPATPDLSSLSGKTVTIQGYNKAEGNVVLFKNATTSFIPTGSVNLVFDNITVKHQDGSTTEDWIFPSGGSITFGENCLYEHGYRADRNLDLKMYIGAYYNTSGGTINFNAKNVQYAELGALSGWIPDTSPTFTTNGDITYNFNAGKFDGVYGGVRITSTGYATLNGDVYYNFNGADLTSAYHVVLGNYSNGIVNGNIFFNFNGGKINNTLRIGSVSSFTDSVTAYGNLIALIDAQSIKEKGENFTLKIIDGTLPTKHGKTFLVINNAEDLESNSKLSLNIATTSLNYYLSVKDGKLIPEFEKSSQGSVGNFLGFRAVPDVSGNVPAINGEPIAKNSSGFYSIPESSSVREITFIADENKKVYVSTDGVIAGFTGTVYTSVSEAFTALGSSDGTIYIEGEDVLPATPNLSALNGKTVTISGYGDNASGNKILFKNATTSFIPTGSANLVFDNITVKHQDGSTTEDWIFPSGGSITFGSGCLYEHGYRADRDLNLKMHIGAYYNTSGGMINFNAEKVEYAELGALAGWIPDTSPTFTTTGDITYNLNAGKFDGVYGGVRITSTGYATLNGDVFFNFNGADISSAYNLALGNYSNGIVNGNIFFNFNGGKVNNNLKIGSVSTPSESVTSYGNLVAIINAEDIKKDNNNFSLKVIAGNLPKNHGNSFLIINNAEDLSSNQKASVTVTHPSLDYYISVKDGKITPVFEKSSGGKVGAFLGFTATPDVAGNLPSINGKTLTKNSSGYYVISASSALQEVTFAENYGKKLYVSTDGAIAGYTGTVYTSVSEAFTALGSSDGTIYIEGEDVLPATPNLSALNGKTVTISGYGDNASGNKVLFKNAPKSFIPTGSVNIVFDNITLKHEDGTTDEDWIFPSGGSITFGAGCLYEEGTRTDRNTVLKLYIGSYYGTSGGTITFNAESAEFAELGSLCGWFTHQSPTFTTAGDVTYNLNAGKFGGVYGGVRNTTTGYATLNGDVYFNFNGAKLPSGAALATGNAINGSINGNIFFNFNGGNIERTLTIGGMNPCVPEHTKYGNTVVSINSKEIVADGKVFNLSVADGTLPETHGKTFVIINHYEKLSQSTTASAKMNAKALDYNIRVVAGTVTPVFEKSSGGNVGKFLGFDVVSDTEGLVPAISGKKIEKNADGYYDISSSSSVQTVEFATEDELISTITISSGISGVKDITTEHSNGNPYTLPECSFDIPEGKMFGCWTSGGKDFFPGENVLIFENTTFTANFVDENTPYVFYVNTENGSDNSNGLYASSAFKTLSAAISAVNSSNTSLGRIYINGKVNYENLPAYSKEITFIGGEFTAKNEIVLVGDTVFNRVKISDKTLYTAGNSVRFTEESENVTGVKLVLSAKTGKTYDNKAILDGGTFLNVVLSETADTENTYLSANGAIIKKLTLGSFGAKVKNLIFSLSDSPVSVWSAGDTHASGNITVLENSEKEKFGLDENYFDAETYTYIKNESENVITISDNGILNTPNGKYVYALGEKDVFCAVDGKITITKPGYYKILETSSYGTDYFAYPNVPDGKYFDKWQDAENGHFAALYTQNEKPLSYYVSQNGNDKNCGTSVYAPFKTLTAAVNALSGKDGKVIIMDTVYWSESSSVCNVPLYTGTITFEGLSENNIANQIIDYSEHNTENAKTASLRLSGNSVFKNITFREHHYKSMYTNGYNLRLEGKIGYLKGTSGDTVYTLNIGKYTTVSENADIYLGAQVDIGTLNIGHNSTSSITGNTRVIIDGANINNLALCGTGSRLGNVDVVYVSGNVAKFTTPQNTNAVITGNLRIVRSNGNPLVLNSKSYISHYGKTYEYNCAEGIAICPVGTSKTLFKVVSDVTVKAQNVTTNEVYYSSKGGYIGLPEGSYNITKAEKDYYTNDGETITILSDTALSFDSYLYHNENGKVFAGWCYEGKTYGPSSGEVIAAGTVLKANYVSYDPEDVEFGIIGVQTRVATADVSQGLRYIINKDNSFEEKFNIKEFGALILPKQYLSDNELCLDGKYTVGEKTYSPAYTKAEKLYAKHIDGVFYTLCLTNTAPKDYDTLYTCRAYAICEDANGENFTVYSDAVSTSFVNIVRHNTPKDEIDKAAFEEIESQWRNSYFGEGTTPVSNSYYPTAYTVNSNGVSVREITINSVGEDKTPVQVAMITDAHLYTYTPDHTGALEKALVCANFADQVVLCGDIVENMSEAPTVKLLKETVFDVYPDSIVLLGNHEYFAPNSGRTTDDVKATVDSVWPHDPDYYSRLIDEKVLVVTADNARQIEYGESVYYFTEEKCDLLEKDITYARENGYTILFFCHVGLTTLDKTLFANERMYNLVTSNADVIKGCFSGHGHVDNTATLKASYIDDNGNEVQSSIPYYWLRGCAEENNKGHVLYINVK